MYVVKKADTSGNVDDLRMLRPWLAIEVDEHLNLGFVSLALDRSRTRFHGVLVDDSGGAEEVAKVLRSCCEGRNLTLGAFGFTVRSSRCVASCFPTTIMAEDTDTLLAILASLLPEPIPSHDILLDALVRAEGDIQAASQLLSSNPRASTVSVFLSTSPSKTGGLARGRKRKGLDSWLQTDNSPAKCRRTTSPERSLKPLSAGTIKPPSSTRPASTSSSNARSIYDVLHAPSRARSTSPSKTSSPTSHNALKPASSSSRPLSSSEKPRLNVNEALRPPPSTSHAPQRHPPLTLSTPALVAQHTPCTLHPSILPPKLASDVFHTMLAESKDWTRNKWYLFDRLVESPHSTAMYTRSGVGESEEVQDLHKVAAAWYATLVVCATHN